VGSGTRPTQKQFKKKALPKTNADLESGYGFRIPTQIFFQTTNIDPEKYEVQINKKNPPKTILKRP
jgi:hypothetical protein